MWEMVLVFSIGLLRNKLPSVAIFTFYLKAPKQLFALVFVKIDLHFCKLSFQSCTINKLCIPFNLIRCSVTSDMLF